MKHSAAFTLIELLVVIVIIGILATVSTATFSGSVEKARDAKLLVAWTNDQKQQEADCIANQERENCSRELMLGGNVWSQYNVTIGERVDYAASLDLKEYGEEVVCIENDLTICDSYGGLYTYSAALKLCPDGWKLPSFSDFTDLIVTNTDDIFTENSTTGLNLFNLNVYCDLGVGCTAGNANAGLYWTDEEPVAMFGPDPTHVLVAMNQSTAGILSNNYVSIDGTLGGVRCVKE